MNKTKNTNTDTKHRKKRQEIFRDPMTTHPTGATYLGEGMFLTHNGRVVTESDVWGF